MNFIEPFPRFSALHMFIEVVIREILFDENVDEKELSEQQQTKQRFAECLHLVPHLGRLPVEYAFEFYGIECTSFQKWLTEHDKRFEQATADDVYEYYSDLSLEGPLDKLVEQAVSEVFFVLFQNRGLLLDFNDMLAGVVSERSLDEVPEDKGSFFSKDGILNRVSIPIWVQRAVFYRDRGHCVLCHCDLSGILSAQNLENYDHIVPLAKGGLNDVTNIQLLCFDCNSKKRHHEIKTSQSYEVWYPMAE